MYGEREGTWEKHCKRRRNMVDGNHGYAPAHYICVHGAALATTV